MDVKRYNGIDIEPDPEGAFVYYDDIKHLLTRPDPMSKEEANELIHGLLASHYTAPLTYQAIRDKLIAVLTGITRPDPAEVERAIDELLSKHYDMEHTIEKYGLDKQEAKPLKDEYNKARADLLKAIGGE
jgi:hypothetical protein